MNKTIQTLRYLAKGHTWFAIICFLALLGNVTVTNLIFNLTDRYDGILQPDAPIMAPLEFTASIFAVLIGMLLFLINFKVGMANGVSRKTYLLANIPAAGIVAAAFACFNLVIRLVHRQFRPMFLTSDLLYPQAGWAGILIYQVALYFLIIVSGWLITLAYYRSSTLGKWAISLAPFALFGLLKIANAQTGGVIFQAIVEYQHFSMSSAGRAAISMLVYAAILCALVYLLIRRAPLKNN